MSPNAEVGDPVTVRSAVGRDVLWIGLALVSFSVLPWWWIRADYAGFLSGCAMLGTGLCLLAFLWFIVDFGTRPLRYLMIPALAGSCYIHGRTLDHHFEQATERAARIHLALAAFRTDQGACPESLEQLVPHYLPEIPSSGVGPDEDFAFRFEPDPMLETCGRLGFDSVGFTWCVESRGQWHCGD